MKEEPSIAVWEDRRLLAIIFTVAAVLLFGGGALVYIHQTYPDLRASIVLAKDLFIGFFTVSGILVAAESLRRSALSSRRLLALRFVDDWGPELSKSRWRSLANEIAKCDSTRIQEIWNSDAGVRQEVVDLLNSCERIAQAVNDGSADERTIRERLGLRMRVCFSEVSPLVLYLRQVSSNPQLFVETEHLLARWQERDTGSR